MSAWDDYLVEIEAEWREHPEDFLRQPTISRCLHPEWHKWYDGYWYELKGTNWFSAIMPKIADGKVGKPYSRRDVFKGISPVTVGHAYNLHVMERHMGVSIIDNEVQHVTEIGGGYGNLARMARKLGYVGEWTIVDFPIMLEIQEKYLRDNGIKGVEFATEVPPMKYIPHPSVLLATFSVSEMPMDDRIKFERCYAAFDKLFFAHNDEYDGISNLEYFYDLAKRLKALGFDVDWRPDFCRQKRRINHWFLMAT